MAVYTTQGSSPWGALGALMTVGGALTGNPWLSAIGAGANAMSGNGGAGGLAQALGGAAGCFPGWTNPAAGSMVSGYDADTAIWQDYFKKNGGYSAWLR